MDRKYIMTGLGYAIIGLVLGIYMAATKNHLQLVAHAHIMLLGFVVSIIYGAIYKVWIINYSKPLATAQFWLHQLGTLVLVTALYCLYGGYVPDTILGPILGISSIMALVAMILMKVIFIKHAPK